MTEKRTFRVDHPAGCITICPGEYFSTVEKKKINKFLRLARQFCTDEQRIELAQYLLIEAARLDNGIRTLHLIETKRVETLNEFFEKSVVRETSAEKTLAKRRDKVRQYAEELKKERWRL